MPGALGLCDILPCIRGTLGVQVPENLAGSFWGGLVLKVC